MNAHLATAEPVRTSPTKRLLNRHPLLAYFVLAFLVAWIVWLPLVLSQSGIGLLPYTVSFTDAFNPLVGFAGITLVAFVVTAATEGRAGVRRFRSQILRWRIGVRWYLLVLLGMPLIFLLSGAIWRGVPPVNTIRQEWLEFLALYLPETVLIGLLVNLWEEIGWMGFALPRLQRRYGPVPASAIVGTIFALFHFPLFFIGGMPTLDTFLVYIPLLILIAIPHRIVMTWLYNNTKGSIIIALLFHAAYNSANNHLPDLFPGVSDPGRYIFLAITWSVVAALLLIFTRGQLSYKSDDARRSEGASLGGVDVPVAQL